MTPPLDRRPPAGSWAPTRPLVFGLAAKSSRSAEAAARFCERIEHATSLSLRLCVTPSYAGLREGIRSDSIDLAWLPPLVALDLEDSGHAALLCLVKRRDPLGYHSALFTRADSSFSELEDLRGAVAAWVSRESASGFCVPRWQLLSRGIDPRHAFREELFLSTHQAVVRAVLDGRADVGATHVALDPSGRLASAPWMGLGATTPEVRVLLLVGPIPGDVVAAARSLPRSTRRVLSGALLSFRPDDELVSALFEASSFEPAPDGHLGLLRGLARFGATPVP